MQLVGRGDRGFAQVWVSLSPAFMHSPATIDSILNASRSLFLGDPEISSFARFFGPFFSLFHQDFVEIAPVFVGTGVAEGVTAVTAQIPG